MPTVNVQISIPHNCPTACCNHGRKVLFSSCLSKSLSSAMTQSLYNTHGQAVTGQPTPLLGFHMMYWYLQSTTQELHQSYILKIKIKCTSYT
uniref:Uncharacterized protein n=1 Tax=Anguilla anguilla TaxID=7936 RepID=A0A0E9W9Q3_ANGAN